MCGIRILCDNEGLDGVCVWIRVWCGNVCVCVRVCVRACVCDLHMDFGGLQGFGLLIKCVWPGQAR